MKNKSYIGISFIVLIFGIYAIPKIVNKFKENSIVKHDRLNRADTNKLSFLVLDGEPKKIPDFAFLNQDSLIISNADYANKVYVIDFFFTSCPTICPVMTTNMSELQKSFGDNENFAIASFSIDPSNDSPSVMKKYAENYGINSLTWNLLTGDIDDIYELSNKGLNIFAGINPDVEGGFEHQGHFALVDQNGFIRCRKDKHGNPIVYYLGTEKEQIEMIKADIELLLNEK